MTNRRFSLTSVRRTSVLVASGFACSLQAAFAQPAAAPEAAQPEAPQPIAEQPAPVDLTLADSPLSAVTIAVRVGNWKEAKAQLLAIDVEKLKESDTARWYNLAARTALRLGDRAWLEKINAGGALDENGDTLMIMGAMRFLLAGKWSNARHALESVDRPEMLSEIPRRRYLQLWARLEQMEKRPAAERIYVAKLVDFAGTWSGANCQMCHANSKKFGKETTTFDAQNWWVGDRYVELLKADGDAVKIRDAAAEQLKKTPNDASARLRLAYALRALGEADKSREELRAIPWTQWPDRVRPPLRFGTFP